MSVYGFLDGLHEAFWKCYGLLYIMIRYHAAAHIIGNSCQHTHMEGNSCKQPPDILNEKGRVNVSDLKPYRQQEMSQPLQGEGVWVATRLTPPS